MCQQKFSVGIVDADEVVFLMMVGLIRFVVVALILR